MEFACDGPGRIVVEEPDWIRVERVGEEVVVTTTGADWLTDGALVEGAAVTNGRTVRYATEGCCSGPDSEVRLPVPDGADQVMIRLEGRWIARWFELRR